MVDTLMTTERDIEWQELGEARAKRRRGIFHQGGRQHLQDCTNITTNSNPYYTTSNGTMQSNENVSRDYFDQILEGHVNGMIHSSWMKDVHKIGRGSYVADNGQHANSRDALKALHMQLLQVKRRLWPASERCAHACRTAPYDQFEEARRICNPMEPLGGATTMD